jgi:NAD(P)-dependent dehydrogenase (short-subunit alcohol dehydrogenase family)
VVFIGNSKPGYLVSNTHRPGAMDSTTTFAEYDAKTEAATVVSAFASSIIGRTILITGVNKLGLGYATAHALASQSPYCLILCARSGVKLEECVDSLRLEYPHVDYRPLVIDLSSQASVRKAAQEVLSWKDVPSIDIVINNAAIMNVQERILSEEGIELHLATNHVGHFLFTNLIMPKILISSSSPGSGAARIVNVSSMAVTVSALRASDLTWEKPTAELPEKEKPNIALMKLTGLKVDENMSYIPMAAYAHSKTASVLYSVALNEMLYEKYGVLSITLHPGEIKTELQRHTDPVWLKQTEEWKKKLNMGWRTLEQGPSTILVAALDPKLSRPNDEGYGQFLSDCQITTKLPPYVFDKKEAYKLWNLTEDLVKDKFSW